jgi:hypothetical protein
VITFLGLPVGAEDSSSLVRSLTEKIARVTARGDSGPANVHVSEAELNAYLNDSSSGLELPPGLTDIVVTFKKGGVKVRGWIDLERLQDDLPESVSQFASGLALIGRGVPVELEGRLESGGGVARLDLERVQIAVLSVPIDQVVELVAKSTRGRRYPQGYDLRTPFRLPCSMQKVELEPGRAQIVF